MSTVVFGRRRLGRFFEPLQDILQGMGWATGDSRERSRSDRCPMGQFCLGGRTTGEGAREGSGMEGQMKAGGGEGERKKVRKAKIKSKKMGGPQTVTDSAFWRTPSAGDDTWVDHEHLPVLSTRRREVR